MSVSPPALPLPPPSVCGPPSPCPCRLPPDPRHSLCPPLANPAPARMVARAMGLPVGTRETAEASLAKHLPQSPLRPIAARPWANSDLPKWRSRVGTLQAGLAGVAWAAADLGKLMEAADRLVGPLNCWAAGEVLPLCPWPPSTRPPALASRPLGRQPAHLRESSPHPPAWLGNLSANAAVCPCDRLAWHQRISFSVSSCLAEAACHLHPRLQCWRSPRPLL